MNKIKLTIEQMNHLLTHTNELKGCLAIDGTVSTNLHRSAKKISLKLKDLEDDMQELRKKHRESWRAEHGEISDEELLAIKAFVDPLEKELRAIHAEEHEVEVHLVKISSICDQNELGTRKVILQTNDGKSHENLIQYKSHYLELLDVLILEDDDWAAAVPNATPKKKK